MTLKSNTRSKRRRKFKIYLLDDEFNSFEHVIAVLTTLLPGCNSIRAESIAMITHNVGQCHIYSGFAPEAFVLYANLKKSGLTVSLDRS